MHHEGTSEQAIEGKAGLYLLHAQQDSMDTRENQGQLTSLFRTAYRTISAVL